MIGVVLTQVMEDKEHIITYLSRRLINVKTRYSYQKVMFIFVL
jgi:hypothetical protein